MHRQECLSPVAELLLYTFNRSLIPCVDVAKYRGRTHSYNRARRSVKGIARGYDLISLADIKGFQRQYEGIRSVVCGYAMVCPDKFRKLKFELFYVGKMGRLRILVLNNSVIGKVPFP